MDYNKMKVNDLKAELAARNLDTKGVKAVLVERLKEAIEKESTGSGAESTPTVTAVKKLDAGTPNQSTPIRRSRRRSMTRSPSPAKVETSVLESVSEVPEETDASESTCKKRRTRSITKSPSPAKTSEVRRLEAVEEETDLSGKVLETTPKKVADPVSPDKTTPVKPILSAKTASITENINMVSSTPSTAVTPEVKSPVKPASTPIQIQALTPEKSSDSKTTPQKKDISSTITSKDPVIPAEQSPTSKPPVESERASPVKPAVDAYLVKSTPLKEHVYPVNDKQTDKEDKDSNIKKEDSLKDKCEEDLSKSTKRKSTSPPQDSPTKAPRPKHNQTSIDFDDTEIEPTVNENETFTLSWYDSHLNLDIDHITCYQATPLNEGVFALLWAGARANFGIIKGRAAYEVLLKSTNDTHINTEEPILNEFRLGWSVGATNLQLGEEKLSFAYCSTGTKAVDSKFEKYGVEYKINDVIGVYLDLDSNPCKVKYTVNNEDQGTAFEFEKHELHERPLFPHICSKNIAFTVNFGQYDRSLLNRDPEKPIIYDTLSEKKEEAADDTKPTEENTDSEISPETHKANVETLNKENEQNEKTAGETTEETSQNSLCINSDYKYVAEFSKENLVRGICAPLSRKECEVIFLIGLPGSGKTNWVENYIAQNTDKNYTVLNTEALLKQMSVLGEPRQPSNTNKWSRLIGALAGCLNKLTEIAKTRRRNFIIDQTNAFFSEQKRKVRGFGGFLIRRAVVVLTEEEEYNRRLKMKQDKFGKDIIPETNLINMKAHINIPVLEHGWFTDITFAELDEEKTRELVLKMNEDNRKLVKPHKNKGQQQRRGTNSKQQWNQNNRYNNQQYQQGRYNTQQRYNSSHQYSQNRNYRPGNGYGRNDGNYSGGVRYRNQNDWMRSSGRYYNRGYQGNQNRRYDGGNRSDYNRGYSGGWNQHNSNCWNYEGYQGNDNEEFNTWWQ